MRSAAKLELSSQKFNSKNKTKFLKIIDGSQPLINFKFSSNWCCSYCAVLPANRRNFERWANFILIVIFVFSRKYDLLDRCAILFSLICLLCLVFKSAFFPAEKRQPSTQTKKNEKNIFSREKAKWKINCVSGFRRGWQEIPREFEEKKILCFTDEGS